MILSRILSQSAKYMPDSQRWVRGSVEPNEIVSILQKIADLGLSFYEYFEKHAVPL